MSRTSAIPGFQLPQPIKTISPFASQRQHASKWNLPSFSRSLRCASHCLYCSVGPLEPMSIKMREACSFVPYQHLVCFSLPLQSPPTLLLWLASVFCGSGALGSVLREECRLINHLQILVPVARWVAPSVSPCSCERHGHGIGHRWPRKPGRCPTSIS